MHKTIALYQSRVINLGWKSEHNASILHYWHTRAGMSLAVSACERVARQAILRPGDSLPHCALCDILQTKRHPDVSRD